MTVLSSGTQSAVRCSFLVIGYGNELRGDDAVGARVARAVADWQLPSVEAKTVQQLTPELAADIAAANYVIFVDACGESCAPQIHLDPIVVNKQALDLHTMPSLTHTCQPTALLALTHVLYGRHPQAWLLQIPTEQHDIGRSLSDTASCGVDKALRKIEQFLNTYLCPACVSS